MPQVASLVTRGPSQLSIVPTEERTTPDTTNGQNPGSFTWASASSYAPHHPRPRTSANRE
jgi:hypothetical protein